MENPSLSLLIPTVKGREDLLTRLFRRVRSEQEGLYGALVTLDVKSHRPFEYTCHVFKHAPVEILIACDNKECTIGEKRQWLYEKASGMYSWQIDDDDLVTKDAVKLIRTALKEQPDCVTFQEKCIIDGVEKRSNHSLKYADWWENMDGFDYVRTPFFKSVIKTEIARSVPVPHMRFGEDHAWSRLIKPLLKTEVHIDEEIYHYIHNSSNHNERYGIRLEDNTDL